MNSQDEVDEILKGRPLGSRYILGEVIGTGATGRVYRAQVRDGGQVAIKLLRPELSDDPAIVTGFVRERQLLRSVTHPNVVQVIDLVAEGDDLGIVMQLVPGGDMRRTFTGALPGPRALRLMAQVADGLLAIHNFGLVHRDLKPSNVLCEDEEDGHYRLRLTDFGIAELGTRQTRGAYGTPGYMAPEVGAGLPVTSAADMYALGVILFELLTGAPPFTGENPLALQLAHTHGQVPRPVGLPDSVWSLLDSLLAKEPADRPTAEQAGTELRRLSTQIPDGPFPFTPITTLPPPPSAITADDAADSPRQVIDLSESANHGAREGEASSDGGVATLVSALAAGSAATVVSSTVPRPANDQDGGPPPLVSRGDEAVDSRVALLPSPEEPALRVDGPVPPTALIGSPSVDTLWSPSGPDDAPESLIEPVEIAPIPAPRFMPDQKQPVDPVGAPFYSDAVPTDDQTSLSEPASHRRPVLIAVIALVVLGLGALGVSKFLNTSDAVNTAVINSTPTTPGPEQSSTHDASQSPGPGSTVTLAPPPPGVPTSQASGVVDTVLATGQAKPSSGVGGAPAVPKLVVQKVTNNSATLGLSGVNPGTGSIVSITINGLSSAQGVTPSGNATNYVLPIVGLSAGLQVNGVTVTVCNSAKLCSTSNSVDFLTGAPKPNPGQLDQVGTPSETTASLRLTGVSAQAGNVKSVTLVGDLTATMRPTANGSYTSSLSGLTPGTTYSLQAEVCNTGGQCARSNILGITTAKPQNSVNKPPRAPSLGVISTQASSVKLSVNRIAPGDGQLASVHLNIDDRNLPVDLPSGGSGRSSVEVTGLEPGTSYVAVATVCNTLKLCTSSRPLTVVTSSVAAEVDPGTITLKQGAGPQQILAVWTATSGGGPSTQCVVTIYALPDNDIFGAGNAGAGAGQLSFVGQSGDSYRASKTCTTGTSVVTVTSPTFTQV